MLKQAFLFLILTGWAGFLYGQQAEEAKADPKFSHHFAIGYNIGGLAPVSFPNTIRQIKSYSPGFSPSLSYQAVYRLSERWGIGSGIRMDWKGMRVSDSVQYFHTLVSMDTSSIEGDFTGTNTTKVKNIYISLPVQAVYITNNNWKIKLGMYFSYLVRPGFSGAVSDGYLRKGNSLGEKINIDYATFNFDKEQRRFDYGVSAGGEKKVYKGLGVTADLQWGLRPVFPGTFTGISFKMYNIFATLGICYAL